MHYSVYLMALLILLSCNTRQEPTDADVAKPLAQEVPAQKARPVALDHGRIFESGGDKWLYGGENSSWHFNITHCSLADSQFHYGIGREKFPALLEPRFVSVEKADVLWPDSARFLLARKGDDIKAYAIKDLTRHEVVNDVLDGEPIMAAYCILADLGAIYTRTYGSQVLTFALSGYTYYDPDIWGGLDGFVLWDRETESLWWPLIDCAVSGPLRNVGLKKLDETYWMDTTWQYIRNNFPEAQVLESGQDFERPVDWPLLDQVAITEIRGNERQ